MRLCYVTLRLFEVKSTDNLWNWEALDSSSPTRWIFVAQMQYIQILIKTVLLLQLKSLDVIACKQKCKREFCLVSFDVTQEIFTPDSLLKLKLLE